MQVIRSIKCPECGNEIEEVCTFNEDGQLIENHSFCSDSGGDCLWGGAYPYNHRNIENNKIREQRKLSNDSKERGD